VQLICENARWRIASSALFLAFSEFLALGATPLQMEPTANVFYHWNAFSH
jgi:hypothetical protein